MIKKAFALLLVIIIGIFLSVTFAKIPFGYPKTVVGKYYLDHGVSDLGGINIVTSIVVLYRGFDTLGEVTVLFLAATGLGMVLAGLREKDEKKRKKTDPSLIMRT